MTTLPPPPSKELIAAPAPAPAERRVRRRSRSGLRARWLAARTRNAARHGLLISSIGALVVIVTLLMFVLIPRQADRQLTAQLAALSPERDTLPLLTARDSSRAESARLDALFASSTQSTASAMPGASVPGVAIPGAVMPGAVAPVMAAVDSARGAASPARISAADSAPPVPVRDSALTELQQQIGRVKQAPLVEGYRTLADARLLRDDARVRTLLDSIEQLHSEREAYAALSGPDARYATITTRLTQLGQRLSRIAEAVYATAYASASAVAGNSGVSGVSVTGSIRNAADSGVSSLLTVQAPLADSALLSARRAVTETLERTERAFSEARTLNADLRQRRAALRGRMQIDIPPIARLLASLVLGLVVGFAVVLWREMRRPTVGDEQELESLTKSHVIVHLQRRAAGAASTRRRSDQELPPIMHPSDPAWPSLHLSLSQMGDVSCHVEIVADQPVLAGAVALNLAAVAAHESRATILIDAARDAQGLVPLLPASVIAAAVINASGLIDSARSLRWDAPRSMAIGRDTFIDIVLPRRVRAKHRAPAAIESPTAANELRRLAVHHDLAVYVTDRDLDTELPAETDVVLCARLGVTTLAWLTHTMGELDARGRRVRAVLLWSADLPHAR